MKKFKEIVSNTISVFIAPIINFLLGKLNLVIIFRGGKAVGDHVYMSSVLREISLKKNKKIILFTSFYELYLNNPRIFILFKFKLNRYYIGFFLRSLKGKNILNFESIKIKKQKQKYFIYYHEKRDVSLAFAMSEHFNLNLDYSNLKNEFFFNKFEILNYEKKFQLPDNYALIQSTTKKTFTNNKEWKISGMQKIVDTFSNVNWFQIGTINEPKLKNCEHLLDLNLREVAYIIYKSNFIVSYEGLFNHLASCFSKKNFLIHTGFLHINSINYKNNILIHANDKMSCYPCFDLNCKNHNLNFIENLEENKVLEIIKNNIT